MVQHNFRHLTAAQFDNDAHTVFVRLVTDLRNTLDLAFLNQFSDALLQSCLADLVRQLGDDDTLTTAIHRSIRPGAHIDTAATGMVGLPNSFSAVDNARGRKVWPRQVRHQSIDVDLRVIDKGNTGVDHFSQVVRWNVGRHPHRDSCCAVDQQIGDFSR